MQREQTQAEDMSIQILSAGPCKYDMIYKAGLNYLTLDSGQSHSATVKLKAMLLALKCCSYAFQSALMCVVFHYPQHDNAFIIVVKRVWSNDSIWLNSALYLEPLIESTASQLSIFGLQAN